MPLICLPGAPLRNAACALVIGFRTADHGPALRSCRVHLRASCSPQAAPYAQPRSSSCATTLGSIFARTIDGSLYRNAGGVENAFHGNPGQAWSAGWEMTPT